MTTAASVTTWLGHDTRSMWKFGVQSTPQGVVRDGRSSMILLVLLWAHTAHNHGPNYRTNRYVIGLVAISVSHRVVSCYIVFTSASLPPQ